MQIQCLTEDLVRGVQTVERAAASKDTIPILTGILIDAGTHGIVLKANDLEIAIERKIAGTVLQPGQVVVEGKYFAQIVRHLPDGSVELRYNEGSNSVEISVGTVNFSITSLPADEFPQAPNFVDANSWTVAQGSFKQGIEQTVFATGKEESRPFLMGVLFESDGTNLNLVATDSNRLAYRQISLAVEEGTQLEKMNVLVPTRALNELVRLLSDDKEETIDIRVVPGQIGFFFPDTVLISRLIEAKFPDYRQVIPKEHTIAFRVNRQIFQAAIQRSSLVAKRGPAISIFRLEGGVLQITSREAEIGSSTEHLEVEHDGDDIVIAYQAKYLLDVLKVMDSQMVEMRLKQGIGPATLQPVGEDNYRYVLMPVRVPEVMG